MKTYKVQYKMEVTYTGYFKADSLEEAQKMWDDGKQVEFEREDYTGIPELMDIWDNE